MGQQILYCAACQSQLRGRAFDSGDAVRAAGKAYCAGCVPEGAKPDVLETAPTTPRRGTPPTTRKSTSSSTKMSTVRDGGDKPTRRWSIPKDQKSNTGMVVGGIVGGVVLLGIILAAAGSSSSAPKPPPAPVPAPPPVVKPPAPAPTPVTPPPSSAALERQKAAIRAINDADAFAEKNPENLMEIARRYAEALKAASGTEEFARAQQKADAASRAIQNLDVMAKTALVAKLREAMANERFKEVMEILRKSETDRPDPAWAREVDALRTEYRAQFRGVMVPLKKEGQEAVKAGDEARVAAIRKRVASWGLPGMVEELETGLAKVKPMPKKDPGLGKYHDAWSEAMTRGRLGDYEGAIALLEKAGGEATASEVKKAASQDAAMMKKAMEIAASTPAAVAGWKEGQVVALRYRDANGAFRRAEGKIEEVAHGRVVLEDGTAVEAGEITLASILTAGGKTAEDPAAALACLLEGDASGANALLGELRKQTPEKYLKWKPGPAPPEEAEARRLYYGALPKLADPLAAGEGVLALRGLVKDHADTGFVKRNRKAIDYFGKQGGEFLIASGRMTASGTFSRTKTEEVPVAWQSKADSPESERPSNYVELKFAAVPKEPYRLWMYLGACCAEVMTFTVQGSDFQVGRSGPMAVPGSEHQVSVRARVLGSRRTHVNHGGAKNPEKWYWVQIPLPEYETGGEKSVRLLTNQKGFAVGYAFLTAAGSSPPKGTSLEKRLKQRPAAAAASTRAGAGLVALYSFREGKGDVVKDVSGVGAPMDLKINRPGAVEWLGSQGLKVKDSVKISADSEKKLVAACKKTNELTVEAWITPASDEQKGPARIVTFSTDSGNRFFTLGQGMSKGPAKNFQMRLQTSKSKPNGYPEFVTSQGTSTAVLTHLVYTRKADGTEVFYIDGQEMKRGSKGGDFSVWRTAHTFLLANEKTGDRPWLGEFHLVAVYDRALTPAEVAANFTAGHESVSVAPKPAGSTRSSNLRSIFAEDFAGGGEKWKRGGVVGDAGVSGSPALSMDYKGINVWGAFEMKSTPTTTVRFKLKALGPVERATIHVWSTMRKDNGRFFVDRPPMGRWEAVEVPLGALKMGWDRSGPPFPDGEKFDNFKITFTAAEEVRILLDDFEILE